MELKIQPLKKKDYKKAMQFAISGMHFDQYISDKTTLNLYGRYFWYMELLRASQVISAYYGDALAGVLIADMKGEPKVYHSFWKKLYVNFFDFLQNAFVKDGVGPYNLANEEMIKAFRKEHHPDGEICFLAANSDLKIKGIGSMLLAELEKREPGKEIYLFTDNNCTYQFYEHRGFERSQEKQIKMEFAEKGEVPLSCYLYSKVCEEK